MTERTYSAPGAILTEREHVVPLDHSKPDGQTITVFSRELAAPDGRDRPYLIFQQGGPGGEATRPTAPPSGWQKRSEEHTSELQSQSNLVCRLLLEIGRASCRERV